MTQVISCGIKDCGKPAVHLGMCAEHWKRTKLYGSPFATSVQSYAGMFVGMPAIKRFELQHEKGEGCWNWKGYIDQDGYGKFHGAVHGVSYQGAHRFSWAFHNGTAVPEGKMVCHSCDNRRCVNPAHLWIGDAASNSADMHQKGRQFRQHGELSHRAKLTEAEALAVLADPRTYTEIAKDYGVATTTITSVKNRVSWGHLKLDFIPPKNPRGSGRGRRNIGNKIDADVVRQIRSSSEQGIVLAKKFGISNVQVSNIRRRKVWKHVTD